MAVCGHCWICGSKFECSPTKSCGDCTDRKPLFAIREGVDVLDGVLAVEVPGSAEHNKQRMICGECEEMIDSGALCALISALKAWPARVGAILADAGKKPAT